MALQSASVCSRTTLPSEASPESLPIDDKQWVKLLARYRTPSVRRSLFELAVTVVPFLLLWSATLVGVKLGHWYSLALVLPAAFFLVRLFMIQHDCGHGSFFRKRRANDLLGRAIGVLTLTPYADWRQSHAQHHATSGNLDRRGKGDIDLLTVAEYQALPRWRRLAYRLSRHPFVLLVLAPVYVFVLRHRLPNDLWRAGRAAWLSTLSTNAAILGLTVGMGLLVGFGDLLLVQLPITLLASSIGIWLFYVQHQFEHTYWAPEGEWTYYRGAMQGSSHYDLPGPLRWLTANIGVHHVHHLLSSIPSYRLNEVLRDYPKLREVGRLTLRQSLQCLRLGLWCEERQRLVSFKLR